MHAGEMLRAAAQLLEDHPERWTKGAFGLGSWGSWTSYDPVWWTEDRDEKVLQVCAIGACALIAGRTPSEVLGQLARQCDAGAPGRVIEINDLVGLESVIVEMRRLADACVE